LQHLYSKFGETFESFIAVLIVFLYCGQWCKCHAEWNKISAMVTLLMGLFNKWFCDNIAHTCVPPPWHTHTHMADMWFISCVCIKGTIVAPVHLQCWPQGGRNLKQCFWKEEIHKQNITGFWSSWMWSCINGLSFPNISKKCSTLINKKSKKDVPLWKHHFHTVTHCANKFLWSLTSNRECHKNRHCSQQSFRVSRL